VTNLVLHDYALDDQCYKVRLLLSVMRLDCELIAVDAFPGREHLGPAYRRLNPLGRLPILCDGDFVLSGAEAILAYLAKAHDRSGRWLPGDGRQFGAVMAWLAFASGDLHAASQARLHDVLEGPGDGPALRQAARDAFRIMDDHMTRRGFDGAEWFVGETATVADIALFPAIALSRDFGVEHEEYPALRHWIRKVRGLPGFVTMPGIPDYH
jgi:glutathione S-transferase